MTKEEKPMSNETKAAWDFEWDLGGTAEEEAVKAAEWLVRGRGKGVRQEIILYRETYSDANDLEGMSEEAMAIVNRLLGSEVRTESSVIADLLRLRALEVGESA